MKKIIIFLAILVFVISFIIIKNLKNKKEDEFIINSGNIEVKEINLAFKTIGRIIELQFEEGEKVKKDEIMARIESDEIEKELELKKAILEEAKIKYEELKKGAREQEIKEGEANLKAREIEKEKAKKDFERAEFLFKNGAISEQKMEEFKKIYDISIANFAKAKENMSLILEGTRKEIILAQEKKIKQAEASIEIIENKLKDTILKSPVDAVVLSKNSEVGEISNPNVPVYTIGDLNNPYVKVYIKEDKLGLIKIGQSAEIISDTYPDKIYEGVVNYISSEAEFTPKNIQTKEERTKLVFEIKISVKNENDELKPGMPVDVKIKIK